ncbi:hypothetical protein Barb7_01177 [Bacteroidales bacterium Barb7]|nr:hypothetical protein Barb7_01177 [Bacteroidales bacterium Barb7]
MSITYLFFTWGKSKVQNFCVTSVITIGQMKKATLFLFPLLNELCRCLRFLFRPYGGFPIFARH